MRPGRHPLRLSVVIVTFNSEASLGECLESLVRTLPRESEIIVVDNASEDDSAAIASQEPLVRLFRNKSNRGYSKAANQGLKKCRGELVVLLNPDTVVTEGWWESLSAHLAQEDVGAVGPLSNCVAGIQFFDRHVAGRGHFLEEIRSGNRGASVETKLLYGFCIMMKRDLIRELDYLDEQLILGGDDLDLAWRLQLKGLKLLVAKDAFVFHKGQASFATLAEAQARHLNEISMKRLWKKLLLHYGEDGVPSPFDLWGISWLRFPPGARRGKAEKASIVVPVFNRADLTRSCLERVFRNTRPPFELIVVDNGSSDETASVLESFGSRIRVIRNSRNLGYAAACNQGIAEASGEYVVLLNNDVMVTEGWLEGLVEVAEKGHGIVGPVTGHCSGTQMIGGTPPGEGELDEFARAWAEEHKGSWRVTQRLVGFCWLIKREVIETIGKLDERFGAGNYEDNDYCLRARLASFKLAVAESVYVHHLGGGTFSRDYLEYFRIHDENRGKFLRKWKERFPEATVNPEVFELENLSWSIEHYHRGVEALSSGLAAEAERFLMLAVSSCPKFAPALNSLAVMKASQGDLGAARELLERVLLLEPGFPEALNNLAAVQVALGERESAERLLEEAVSEDGGNVDALLNLAKLKLDRGEYGRSEELLGRVLAASGDNLDALFLLGACEFHGGKWDAARRRWERVLELDPTNEDALANLRYLEGASERARAS